MGGKKLAMKKQTLPSAADVWGPKSIPKNCGYQKKFKYNIDMNSNGIMGECIDWCEKNCKHRWGWWFEGPSDPIEYYNSHWENQKAFMSFSNRREASAFLLAVGMKNMGQVN